MAKIPENDIPRKDLPVIFVIDTSGSMSMDGKMTQVNSGISEAVEILREFSKKNADANLKIGILKFSSGCEWVTKGLEPFTEFEYENLEAGGLTDLGAALDELNSKLTRHKGGFLGSMIGSNMPIIIFVTDGFPNDDWEKPLDNIWKNKWFAHRNTTKIGIGIGKDADMNVLTSVVGTNEAVCRVDDLTILGRLLRCIAVTSSMTRSSTSITENAPQPEEMLKDAAKGTGKGEGIEVGPKTDPTAVIEHEPIIDGGEWGNPDEW